jgi:hypothetical protein
MTYILHPVAGEWHVNSQIFYNKREALLYASQNNLPEVTWHWHDNVWGKFDRTQLGNQTLPDLYKQRAQQLRDKYDYLILYYSGGADSHNVLMSFLNNNIKVDQLFVQWPFKYLNSDKHKPNNVDNSARNTVSEWDYSVVPTLKYIEKNHPDIKIEFSDWMDNMKPDFFKDNSFEDIVSLGSAGQMARYLDYSKLGLAELDKGRTVGSVWGFDKPYISLSPTNKIYMFFYDQPMVMATTSVGVCEPFYWSPDLPQVAFEMAYQHALYFKANPLMQKFLFKKDDKFSFGSMKEIHRDIVYHTCYSNTWDPSRFQTGKPITFLRYDKDFFIFENSDFKRTIDAHKYQYESIWGGIHPKYLTLDLTKDKQFFTKGFYLTDL